MFYHWSEALVNQAITGLTPRQQAALACFIDLTPKQKIGEGQLAKFGFVPNGTGVVAVATLKQDYAEALVQAQAHCVAYFATLGITSLHDLPFETSRTSIDWQLTKEGNPEFTKPRKAKPKAVVVETPMVAAAT